MRAASPSMRLIAFSVPAASRAAPIRNSSAYPRIEASGVRSSCDASARKRRRRSSLAWRSAKACSRRPSIALSAIPSRPTSVFGVAGLTRRDRSPPAIAPAVSPMRSSGRRPMRTRIHDSAAERGEHRGDDERLDDQQAVERLVDLGQRHGHDDRPGGALVGDRHGAVAQARVALGADGDHAARGHARGQLRLGQVRVAERGDRGVADHPAARRRAAARRCRAGGWRSRPAAGRSACRPPARDRRRGAGRPARRRRHPRARGS